MKTIPFDESARDVWHDASVEVPDNTRYVLVAYPSNTNPSSTIGTSFFRIGWSGVRPSYWRELPAPPKPTPKIVPHSLEHWHDTKVERPEDGKHFIGMHKSGYVIHGRDPSEFNWVNVNHWAYAPETSR